MSPASSMVELPESHHSPVPHAQFVGKAAASRAMRVSVILHRKAALDLASLQGRQLSQPEYARQYGAAQQDFDAVSTFAESQGLAVDAAQSSLLRRRVELHGTVEQFNQAFGVDLHDYELSRGGSRFHAITGPVLLPQNLAHCVQAVLGLDNRPIATPKFRVRPNATPDAGTFTPPGVAQVYSFPAGNGAGQTIGLIELGGGYKPEDIANYFQSLGVPAPAVTAVLLDGGSNAPTTADSADGEVLLDIEVAGGVAPGARIVVYFTTNTDQGFQNAISTAIHDTANHPGVISISWGGPESTWTQAAINSMDTTCESAAALGITITVASGDNGSTDGTSADEVDFPASSPHVLACGGTVLTASGGRRTSEAVWNDQAAGGGATGGGVSTVFPLPAWQAKAGVPAARKRHRKPTHKKAAAATAAGGRGVPDVAGNASPETGYQIVVDGQQEIVGGTSAVAPLWAGLVALLNQQLGRNIGFLNPRLYALSEAVFFDVTSGSNGDFSARAGWDACTGLGSPNGAALLAALQQAAPPR